MCLYLVSALVLQAVSISNTARLPTNVVDSVNGLKFSPLVGSAVAAFYSIYRVSEIGVSNRMQRVFEDGGLENWNRFYKRDYVNNLPREGLLADIMTFIQPNASVDTRYIAIIGRTSSGTEFAYTIVN